MKSYVKQLRHPLTKKRVRVTGRTESELEHRCSIFDSVRRDLRAGLCSPEQAAERLRGPGSIAKRLCDLWPKLYADSTPRSKSQLKSTWDGLIAPKLGQLQPWELTAEVVSTWESSLLNPRAEKPEGYAPKYVEVCWWVLSRMLRLYAGLQVMPWLPYRPKASRLVRLASSNGGARRPRKAFTSLGDLRAVLQKASDLDKRDGGQRLIHIGFFAMTGLRQAEAAGLAWDNVHIDGANPHIQVAYQAPRAWAKQSPDGRPRLPPKNGTRPHQLHESATALLVAQREKLKALGHYRPDGPVFPTRSGTWRLLGYVLENATFRSTLAAAGIAPEGWSVHSLRHSLVTLELEASGGDLRFVQRRSGHKTIRAIEGYVHNFGSSLGRSAIPAQQLPEPSKTTRRALPPRPSLPQPFPAAEPEADEPGELQAQAKRLAREHAQRAGKAYSKAYARALGVPAEPGDAPEQAKLRAQGAGRRASKAARAALARHSRKVDHAAKVPEPEKS